MELLIIGLIVSICLLGLIIIFFVFNYKFFRNLFSGSKSLETPIEINDSQPKVDLRGQSLNDGNEEAVVIHGGGGEGIGVPYDSRVVLNLSENTETNLGLKDENGQNGDGINSDLLQVGENASIIVTKVQEIDHELLEADAQAAFYLAVLSNNQDNIKILCENPEINPNLQDKDGKTALHIAVLNNNIVAINVLLKNNKIDPNIRDKNGQTALHLAVLNNNPEAIKALNSSNKKADPNVRDYAGKTAVHFATSMQSIPCLQALFEYRTLSTFKVKDKEGNDVVNLAIRSGNLQIIDLIKQKFKLDVNELNAEQKAFLRAAVLSEYEKESEKLYTDRDGNTLLHEAIVFNDQVLVNELLGKVDSKKYLNERNNSHETPFIFAIRGCKNKEIINALLRQDGIDLNIGFHPLSHKNILDEALKIGDKDIVIALLNDERLLLNLKVKADIKRLLTKDSKHLECFVTLGHFISNNCKYSGIFIQWLLENIENIEKITEVFQRFFRDNPFPEDMLLTLLYNVENIDRILDKINTAGDDAFFKEDIIIKEFESPEKLLKYFADRHISNRNEKIIFYKSPEPHKIEVQQASCVLKQ